MVTRLKHAVSGCLNITRRFAGSLRGLDLNQRPLGYEPFQIRIGAQAPQATPRNWASDATGSGSLWLSFGSNFLGNSWVKSEWSRRRRFKSPQRSAAGRVLPVEPDVPTQRPGNEEWIEEVGRRRLVQEHGGRDKRARPPRQIVSLPSELNPGIGKE